MSHILIPTTNSDGDINRVWVYFKRCDGDASKVKCILCSAELCNIGTEDILWNHVESIHSIGRDLSSNHKYEQPSDKTSSPDDGENSDTSPNQLERPIMTPATDLRPANQVLVTDSSNLSISTTGHHMINNNNNSHHNYNYNYNYSYDKNHISKKSQQASNPISKHRHNYDFDPNHKGLNCNDSSDYIVHSDLTSASMKPSPSSSISKNLISRLSLLSSPVTRKLKFWNKKSFQVNQYDPSFKVIYLGNLGMQLWSKDESYLEKPLGTLWNNYLVNMKTEIVMRLTICNSGLKAITRQHGLTQYWSNRLIFCCCHRNYPRIFSWVYRHEGKKMRQELRCHAVFCSSPEKAAKMVTLLNQRLACALQEFKREKKSNCDTVIGFSSNSSDSPLQIQKLPRKIPLRRQMLTKGSANFRPPLERSKSAPKLTSILEEDDCEESESQDEFEFAESFTEKEEEDDNDDDDDNEDEEDGEGSEGSDGSMKLHARDHHHHHEIGALNCRPSAIPSRKENAGLVDSIDSLNGDTLDHKIDELSQSSGLSSERVIKRPQIVVPPNGDGNTPHSTELIARIPTESLVYRTDVPAIDNEMSSGNGLSKQKELSQNEFIQIPSANIPKNGSTCSSSEQNQLTVNENQHQIYDEYPRLHQTDISSDTKRNNHIGNMGDNSKQQPLDDKAAREILMSWSNLVIK